jgi:cell division protein FtsN
MIQPKVAGDASVQAAAQVSPPPAPDVHLRLDHAPAVTAQTPPAPLVVAQPGAAATTGDTGAPAATETFSIVVGSFRHRAEADSLAADLQRLGFEPRHVRIRLITASTGAWHQVVAGPYVDPEIARREYARVRQMPAYSDARLVVN